MQRGDLITVALQGDAGKPRPALVIQADHFTNLPTLVVLPLTSTILDLPLVRVTVEPSAGTGLRQRSQVIPHPACLHLGLREDGVGRLGEATQPADHGDQMSFTPPVRKGHAKQAASRGAVEMIVRCRTTPQFTAVRILLPASFESLDDLTECSSDKDAGGPAVMLGQQPGLLSPVTR